MSHAHRGHAQHHHHHSARRPKKVRPLFIIARGEQIRSFTLSPWLTATIAGIGLTLLLGYVGATGYLMLRDDLFSVSFRHEQELRQAYEDRIAELRAQIDRVSSRQLLNQDAVDGKMQKILSRQAALSVRQNQLADLTLAARRAGVDLTSPKNDKAAAIDPAATGAPAKEKLAEVERSLDRMEADQAVIAGRVGDVAASKIARINAVLGGIGRHIEIKVPKAAAIGGPYVSPPKGPTNLSTFRDRVAYAAGTLEQLNFIRVAARRLPLFLPLSTMNVSSGFGGRPDPFLKRQAYHTGIDFVADTGTAVTAPAAGVVVDAGPSGGYGNMVDIDHGNGVITRYGHLSRILVNAGQKIGLGTKIGLVGSTGRSTGPHLHYEVRVNGDAIDPMPLIRAGGELRGIL